ncbi:molecular chaperone [Alcanivorax sp. DP30]|uniref:fimbrial biogenesis chaperone n=1 Tax=Alcanivorax sp. DP30 TaxID=2606217 RepID=UPI00136B57F5|nr:fimbria/pilus periplasmic chaperone [Alcanivorax sp. DP30]MZR62337.1 fimbria/pilus periplasmic chaperone [Alcanivorax sp. DP30]
MKHFVRALLITSLTLLSLVAWCGQLTVSPLSMTMAPTQNNATYKLKNGSSIEGFYQIQLFAWEQGDDGESRLLQQDDLIITPPVTLIPANGEQLVRVIQKDPQPSDIEKSYRLVISEVPDTESDQGANLKVLLRMSLPLFVGTPELSHTLSAFFQDGALRIRNTGTAHARLSDAYWQARNQNRKFVIKEGLVGYVLPGRELLIPMKTPPAEGSVAFFTASINGTPLTLLVEGSPR